MIIVGQGGFPIITPDFVIDLEHHQKVHITVNGKSIACYGDEETARRETTDLLVKLIEENGGYYYSMKKDYPKSIPYNDEE
jgi:hypothetical protein